MSVEFIGMIQSQKQSEIHPASGPVVVPDYVRDFARAHETAGFDRILVPHHSTGPSATLTIAFAAAATERIHFMLAHRPGFTAPTHAARKGRRGPEPVPAPRKHWDQDPGTQMCTADVPATRPS